MPSNEAVDEGHGMEALRGKHAVVTGGGRGIGLGIATLFADRGLKVSIVSRSAGRLEPSDPGVTSSEAPHSVTSSGATPHSVTSSGAQRSRDAKGRFFRAQADVTDEAQVAEAFRLCRAANGPIAVLVNNSGIAESAPLVRTSLTVWNQILETNVTGTFLCTRAAVDDMIVAKWGRIINIASTAGLGGAPYIAAYCASKHAVIGFTRAIAEEFAGTGITANAVCPGYTETDMMRKALANIIKHTSATEESARVHLARSNPLGRIATVEEIAEAVVSVIASDQNGDAVVIPGGAIL